MEEGELVKIKALVTGFIVTYLLLSVPAMFGMGVVIDWIPEATFSQKVQGYMVEGFTNNYLVKIVVSIFASVLFSFFLSTYKAK